MGKAIVVLIFILCAFLAFCGVTSAVTLNFFDVTSGTLTLLTNLVDTVTKPFQWFFELQFLPDVDEYGFRDTDVIKVKRFVFYETYDGEVLDTPVYCDVVNYNPISNHVVYSTDPNVKTVGYTVFGKFLFKSAYIDSTGAVREGSVLYGEKLFQEDNCVGETEEITYQYYKHQVKYNEGYFD